MSSCTHQDEHTVENQSYIVVAVAISGGRTATGKLRCTGKPQTVPIVAEIRPVLLFQAGANVAFGRATRPRCAWWDGTAAELEIVDISASGQTMQFAVR